MHRLPLIQISLKGFQKFLEHKKTMLQKTQKMQNKILRYKVKSKKVKLLSVRTMMTDLAISKRLTQRMTTTRMKKDSRRLSMQRSVAKRKKNQRRVKKRMIAAMTTIRKDMAFLSKRMLFSMATNRILMMPEKIEGCKATRQQQSRHQRKVIPYQAPLSVIQ